MRLLMCRLGRFWGQPRAPRSLRAASTRLDDAYDTFAEATAVSAAVRIVRRGDRWAVEGAPGGCETITHWPAFGGWCWSANPPGVEGVTSTSEEAYEAAIRSQAT